MIINWWQAVFYSFCLVTFIQLFYYLYFFLRLAFYREKPVTTSQTHPVSVVICARDEAANLVKNLPGTLRQEYRTTNEVIVVEDNSFDESKYILEDYQRTFKHLQIVELKQEARFIPGKKFPLTVGIKTAKHEIVLLTDADCVPASEYWIEKMQEELTGLLSPVALTFDNAASTEWTVMEVRSEDTFAFLYALSNALSMRGVYIYKVKIRNVAGQTADQFFIANRWGNKIKEGVEQERLLSHQQPGLHRALEGLARPDRAAHRHSGRDDGGAGGGAARPGEHDRRRTGRGAEAVPAVDRAGRAGRRAERRILSGNAARIGVSYIDFQ